MRSQAWKEGFTMRPHSVWCNVAIIIVVIIILVIFVFIQPIKVTSLYYSIPGVRNRCSRHGYTLWITIRPWRRKEGNNLNLMASSML